MVRPTLNEQARALVARLLEMDWKTVPVLQETDDILVRRMTSEGPEGFSAARGYMKRRYLASTHTHQNETWTYTIAGTARIFQDGKQVAHLTSGYLHHTPAGTTHRSQHEAGYEGIEIEVAAI